MPLGESNAGGQAALLMFLGPLRYSRRPVSELALSAPALQRFAIGGAAVFISLPLPGR
jgi:hypothetical protein